MCRGVTCTYPVPQDIVGWKTCSGCMDMGRVEVKNVLRTGLCGSGDIIRERLALARSGGRISIKSIRGYGIINE